MTGGATTPPADMQGAGSTAPYGSDWRSFMQATSAIPRADLLPRGHSSLAKSSFVIVVAAWPVWIRVAPVLAGGAGGYILANDAGNGDFLVADPHFLPAVHITYNDGVVSKTCVADGGSGHSGAISGTVVDYDREW